MFFGRHDVEIVPPMYGAENTNVFDNRLCAFFLFLELALNRRFRVEVGSKARCA